MSEEKAKAKKKGLSPLVIVIILLVIVIVGGGAFGGYLIFSQKNKTAAPVDPIIAALPKSTYEFSNILVNLADTNESHYFKANIYVGYSSTKLDAEIKSKDPILRDAINSVLRSKKSTDFTATGTEQLKKEIKDRLNPYLENGKISDVYFYDILIQ